MLKGIQKCIPFLLTKDIAICYNYEKGKELPMSVKEKIKSFKERVKLRKHRKTYSFIVAGIIVVVCFCWWLFGTNTGWIARTSWDKTFDTHSIHTVTVYDSVGEPVRVYKGTYNVEDRGKYWIIMNVNTSERINVYGNSMIIIDEGDKGEHIPAKTGEEGE